MPCLRVYLGCIFPNPPRHKKREEDEIDTGEMARTQTRETRVSFPVLVQWYGVISKRWTHRVVIVRNFTNGKGMWLGCVMSSCAVLAKCCQEIEKEKICMNWRRKMASGLMSSSYMDGHITVRRMNVV